jgi:rod shape determining protein RodA
MENIDWGLIVLVLALIAAGLLTLYSATHVSQTGLFFRQIAWIGIGCVALLLGFAIDYRFLMRMAWPLYALAVILLVAVLGLGREISGAKRWLSLGPLGIQPSELAKIMVIIWIGYWGSKKKDLEDYGFRELLIPTAILLVPVGLILAEPDLGTAGMVILIAGGMFLMLGIQRSTLIISFLLFLASLPIGWFSLKDYQRLRILSFIDPTRDPLGSGYHALQSKIAVGSGGFLGKGFLHGTQTQLRFLPEHHTDFIFSVVAEEWGFLGAVFIITLFFLLIAKIVAIGLKAKDRFGAMICFGIAIFIGLHVFINTAMTLGLFPVVGVPLPFISYGGSFMFINLACIGVVLSVAWRKYMF